jgi:ABC-type dipeptide/oligopeptide/nickel transport system permease subunit
MSGGPSHAALSLWADAWRQLVHSRLTRGCLTVIALFLAAALYGETVHLWHAARDTTPSYQRVNLDERYLAPGFIRRPFAWANVWHHPLGTDNLGRDVLQRAIQGARIAFLVGVVTALIAIPIGVILGCLAGYFGGWIDEVVVWLYSTVAAMPGLLFILAIAMVVGKGLLGVYLGIGLTTWVGLCRLIRAEVLKHRERPYVQAARALGYSPARIIFRHILPNVFHLVIIAFSLRFPAAIGTEVFMSFLGIGVQGEPSWGIMISNARLRLWQGMWWEMTAVTVAIFAVVLAFNLVGDALRDALDPRLRVREGT